MSAGTVKSLQLCRKHVSSSRVGGRPTTTDGLTVRLMALPQPLLLRGASLQLQSLRSLRRIGTPNLKQLPNPFLHKRVSENGVIPASLMFYFRMGKPIFR